MESGWTVKPAIAENREMGRVLDLQRELWERVARQARKLGTAGRPSLRLAVDEFERSFPEACYRIKHDQFLEWAKRARYFLIGDYHTLPRAQLVAAHFVKTLEPHSVGIEIISSGKQDVLDDWAASSRPASDLLSEVGFHSLWGQVPTRGYEILLEVAREHSRRLIALEDPDSGTVGAPTFENRERAIIQRLKEADGFPCLALVGDLHLHPKRLPRALGIEDCLILHQNHAPYHFAMQQKRVTLPALLRVSKGRYVYQHTHPLLVEESCLVALSGDDQTHVAAPEEWLPAILARVAESLGLPPVEPPTVIATFDPDQRDLLTQLVPDKEETSRLLDRLYIQGMSFLDRNGPLILHLPGCNHQAEAAGKWLALSHAGLPDRSADPAVQLFAEIRLEAAGFLGSLFINPLRAGKSLRWYCEFLDVKLDRIQTERSHNRIQAVFDGQAREFPIGDIPAPDSPGWLVLSRMLGQGLGRQLFDILQASNHEPDKVHKALFHPVKTRQDVSSAIADMHAVIGPSTIAAWRGTTAPERKGIGA